MFWVGLVVGLVVGANVAVVVAAVCCAAGRADDAAGTWTYRKETHR